LQTKQSLLEKIKAKQLKEENSREIFHEIVDTIKNVKLRNINLDKSDIERNK